MQPDHARHRQTNRIIERFNGHTSEVLATHRFEAGQDLAQMLGRENKPALFKKAVHSSSGLDT